MEEIKLALQVVSICLLCGVYLFMFRSNVSNWIRTRYIKKVSYMGLFRKKKGGTKFGNLLRSEVSQKFCRDMNRI